MDSALYERPRRGALSSSTLRQAQGIAGLLYHLPNWTGLYTHVSLRFTASLRDAARTGRACSPYPSASWAMGIILLLPAARVPDQFTLI
ncbi:MAG: hypothetical protein MET45_27240 [Nostoc sp. LLA-1]|nr:hypothetical protein [Cyanocohniella sp. LLY]